MAVHIGSTCFQCVPFVSIKNMDSSEEEDFALLLLAEVEVGTKTYEEKRNKQTNKQNTERCSNHSIMRSNFRCFRLRSHRSRLFGYTVHVFEGMRILEIKPNDYLIPGHIRLRSHRNIRYTVFAIRYTLFGIRCTLYGHGGSHRSSTCFQCALFVSI